MNQYILNTLSQMDNLTFFALDTNYKYIGFSSEHKLVMKNIWNTDIETGISMLTYISNKTDRQKAKENFDRALLGEEFIIDEDYGDNSYFRTFWRNSYRPIIDSDNNIVGVLVLVTELTEQIKIQNRFNELEIFENIINLVNVGVTLADPNQKDMPLVFVNDGFTKMTGYSKGDVLGKNCRFLRGKSRYQENLKIVRDSIKNKKSCEVELINFKKDGSKFINLLNLSPICDKNNNLIYYAGIQLDITDRVEKDKLIALKDIASGLTHEINTALVALKGNLEMLSYDVAEIEDSNLKDYMNDSILKIRESKQTITKIVKSLHYLNASSINTTEKFNLFESLKYAVSLLEEKVQSKEVHIIFQNIDQEKEIIAEKESIIHLWTILIENAIDAVCEVDRKKEIIITINKQQQDTVVSIEDNGAGIEPSILNDIFKPLTKGKEYRGVGIGLSTTKVIVDTHGWEIDFKTSKSGTIFYVTLK